MNQDVDMQVVGMTQMAGTGASNGNNKKFFPKKFGGVSKFIMLFQNVLILVISQKKPSFFS